MKKWFFWMLLGCVLLFGSVFGLYGFKQVMIGRYLANMPVALVPVTATKIDVQNWTPAIDAIGFIEPQNGVMLSSAVSGLVSKILLQSGQKVNAGDVLVVLDSEKEKADLRATNSRLQSATRQRDRLQKMASDKLTSQESLDAAQAEYRSLLAQIDSLQATIERREIRAPFAGKTGIVQVQSGQYLQPGTSIVRIESTDAMRIRFIVGEKDYAKVEVGMTISVSVASYPGRVFDGVISAVEPAIDYQTGVVQIQANIPNNEDLLRAGMYADVEIHQAQLTQQLVLPQSAIAFNLYGETVFVLTPLESPPESKSDANQEAVYVANMRTVKVAQRRGNQALITSGVNAGDIVITSGQHKLSNGAKVKIVADNTLTSPTELPRR